MTQINLNIDSDDLIEAVYDDLLSKIKDDIDTDELADLVVDKIDLDSLADNVQDNICYSRLASTVEEYLDLGDAINDALSDGEYLTPGDLESLAEEFNPAALCSLGRAVNRASQLSIADYFRKIRQSIEYAGGPNEVVRPHLIDAGVADTEASDNFIGDLTAIVNMIVDQRIAKDNNVPQPTLAVNESEVTVSSQNDFSITLSYKALFEVVTQAVVNQKWYIENAYPLDWPNFYHEMVGNLLEVLPQFDREAFDNSKPSS